MKTMQIVHTKSQPTNATRRAGRLTATAVVVATTLLPGVAGASTVQACSGRSIRFVSGETAASDTLWLGQTLPAGKYDIKLVTADTYPERAASDPAGQQTEIIEVAGVRSRDLADGVQSATDVSYGTFTASAPFSSLTAYHRASTPGPNSLWVLTVCVTAVAPAPPTSAPATTAPTTTAPATTAPAMTAPAMTAPVTTAPATTGPATTGPATTGPATTGSPTTGAPSTGAPTTAAPVTTVPRVTTVPADSGSTTTAGDSILGPSTTVAPSSSTSAPSDDVADPFGFGEPIPAGPSITDRMEPTGSLTPADGPSSLPLTGAGLGVVFVALALVAAGTVTTAGAKSLDPASDAE